MFILFYSSGPARYGSPGTSRTTNKQSARQYAFFFRAAAVVVVVLSMIKTYLYLVVRFLSRGFVFCGTAAHKI